MKRIKKQESRKKSNGLVILLLSIMIKSKFQMPKLVHRSLMEKDVFSFEILVIVICNLFVIWDL
jgi:hypothetical protein